MKTIYFLIKVCAFVYFASLNCKTVESKTKVYATLDQGQILGFNQLKLFTARNLLGYIYSEQEFDVFDKRVWRGQIKQNPIKQTINLSFAVHNLAEINPELNELIGMGINKEILSELRLTLINPVEFTLEDISIDPSFVKRQEYFSNLYISSVLKVDKIKIEFFDSQGTLIGAKVGITKGKLNVSTKFNYESKEDVFYFAENAFIGYKVSRPPQNPEDYILQEGKKLKIVILPFDSSGLESDFEKWKIGFAEATSHVFSHNPDFVVIVRNEYQKAIEERKRRYLKDLNTESAISIGKMMDADVLAQGNVSLEGDQIRLTLALIDVETGSLLPNGLLKYDSHPKDKSLIKLSDQWEDFLFHYFQLNQKNISKLSKIGTENDEAWKYFIQGKEKFILMGLSSIRASIKDFESAVRSDENFGEAHAYLAEAITRYQFLDEYNYGTNINYKQSKDRAWYHTQKALEINNNSSYANYVASLYFDFIDKNSEKSIYYAQKAVENNNLNPEFRLRLFRAEHYKSWYKMEPDHPELQAIYEMNPNLYLVNMLLGEMSRNNEKWEKSIFYFKKANIISKLNIDPMLNIAITFLIQKKYDMSWQWIQKAEKINPHSLPILLLQAQYYFYKKEISKSLEILTKAEYLFPKSPKPLELKGNIYSYIEEKKKALEAFQKCASLEPENSLYWKYMGDMNFYLENFELAKEFYLKSVSQNTMDLNLYILLADTFLELKNFFEAEKYYKIILERGSVEQKLESLKGLAEIQKRQKKYWESILIFEKVLTLNPGEISVFLEISLCYYKMNKITEAKNWVEKLLNIEPNHPRANYEYSKYLYRMGNKEKYRNYLEKSCKLGYVNACKTMKNSKM